MGKTLRNKTKAYCLCQPPYALNCYMLVLNIYFYILISAVTNDFNYYCFVMPWKCCVSSCSSNYKSDGKYTTLYRLPREPEEREKWTEAIPNFTSSDASLLNFRICRNHWPDNTPLRKISGGSSRPILPPSVFSCLPASEWTPKPQQRLPKEEFHLQKHFDKTDKFDSFQTFSPQRELYKKYQHVIECKKSDSLNFIFMNNEFSQCSIVVHVINKKTLCSPVTFSGFKNIIGICNTPVSSSRKFFIYFLNFCHFGSTGLRWLSEPLILQSW